MNKGLWTAFFAVAAAGSALAQAQFYVRGEFNGWGLNDPMNDLGGGHYYKLITGLNAGQAYSFKSANSDWSIEAPAAVNVRAVANANGELGVHFYDITAPGDGWLPEARRTGYDDPGSHGWDIMGSFNGWANPILDLTDMGNGRYTGKVQIGAGDYEFKFRKTGDWNVSVGSGFADNGANASLSLANDAEVIFDLDLPNGRYRTQIVPEPATIAALGLGLAAVIRRRRK